MSRYNKNGPQHYRIGVWTFRIDNYEDWKPGYQIHEDDSYHFYDTQRTFRTPGNVKCYIRKRTKVLIKLLIKDLESKKEEKKT